MNKIVMFYLMSILLTFYSDPLVRATVLDDLLSGEVDSHEKLILHLDSASESEVIAFWGEVQSYLSDQTVPPENVLNLLFYLGRVRYCLQDSISETVKQQNYGKPMVSILRRLIDDENLRLRLHEHSEGKLEVVFRSAVDVFLFIPVPEAVDPLTDLIRAKTGSQFGAESLTLGNSVEALCSIHTPDSINAQKSLWASLRNVDIPAIDRMALGDPARTEEVDAYFFRRLQFGTASALAVYGALPLDEVLSRLLYLIEEDEREAAKPNPESHRISDKPAWKLAAFYPDTREALFGLLESRISAHVEIALMMIAHEGLVAEAEQAVRFLTHDSKDVRMKAFEAIVYNNRVDLLESLKSAFYAESDSNTKERMMFAFGLMVGAEPAQMLHELYESASDPEIKRMLRDISREQRGRNLPASLWIDNLFRSRAAAFLPSIKEDAR